MTIRRDKCQLRSAMRQFLMRAARRSIALSATRSFIVAQYGPRNRSETTNRVSERSFDGRLVIAVMVVSLIVIGCGILVETKD